MNKVEIPFLKSFLREYLPYVDEHIPTDINRGGCGTFALLLSGVLTQLSVPHQIYVLYYEPKGSGHSSLVEFLSTGDQSLLENCGEDHIVVEITGALEDSSGIAEPEMLVQIAEKIPITIEQLELLVKNGNWSPVYDRTCTSDIKKMLDDIPELLKSWKPGTYQHNNLREKKVNSHTEEMRTEIHLNSLLKSLLTA